MVCGVYWGGGAGIAPIVPSHRSAMALRRKTRRLFDKLALCFAIDRM